MNVSADARDPYGTQAAASPANPDLASNAADTLRDQPTNQPASPGAAPLAPRRKPGGEEPDMTLEPDLPSDGRDAVGEAMIRDLPQRPELSEPPSQPHPSSQAT